jgi:branched-chain amino acid transport system substrate-binding protein
VIVAVNQWKAAHGGKLHGHELRIRAEDDGCTAADVTTQAAGRLLRQEGLIGVIGPQCSAGAKGVLPAYAAAGIVAIAGAATQSDLASSQPAGGFFFRTAYRNDLQGTVIASYVSGTLGARRVALVDDGEAYGQDLANATAQRLEARGVQVTRASVRRGAVDFSTAATQVVQATPDFVGFAGFNPEAALFYRQLRDAGYAGPFGAGDGAASVTTFVAPVSAKAAEGVYFTGCSPVLPAAFRAAFTKVHGAEPSASPFTTHFADAARILLDAVDAVAAEQPDGSLVIDPAQLRDAVRAMKLPDGFSGAVAFDAAGDRLSTATELSAQARELGLAGCQVQNGTLVTLFP